MVSCLRVFWAVNCVCSLMTFGVDCDRQEQPRKSQMTEARSEGTAMSPCGGLTEEMICCIFARGEGYEYGKDVAAEAQRLIATLQARRNLPELKKFPGSYPIAPECGVELRALGGRKRVANLEWYEAMGLFAFDEGRARRADKAAREQIAQFFEKYAVSGQAGHTPGVSGTEHKIETDGGRGSSGTSVPR